MSTPRYIVGIDLGTTNCVLAYIDTSIETDVETPTVQVLSIPQIVKAGTTKSNDRLPSFLYLPAEGEFAAGSFDLPWGAAAHVVGELARSRGAEVPGRVVTSAKSWLCAAGADPTQAILPWQAPDDVPRVSAVDAEAAFLSHLRAAWDAAMPVPLAKQDLYVAVPASFDAAARDLTVRACEQAGLRGAKLLEEPQAAFYAWLSRSAGGWREQVQVGDVVLVCDIGGGTTDLTLVAVGEENGALTLERKAVGDHILLGGDNMDLTLAHTVRAKLADAGTKLDEWQFRGLLHACRDAKEKLLDADAPATTPVVVLGRSRKVVGGAVRTEVARADVEAALVDGFFPTCSADEAPRSVRRVGLQELGLPYASDPAISRHVAGFLGRHRDVAAEGVSAVLFNGGVTHAARFRARMVELLSTWRGTPVRVLQGLQADLAVAEGAATYGLARRGRGMRIRGGTARAYYVGIETAAPAVPGLPAPVKALCIAPFGMEEGSQVDVPGAEFGLVVGEPAEFRLFGSSVRRDDAPGTLVDGWPAGEIDELAPIEAVLDGAAGSTIPVRLRAHATELGTLELWCVGRDESQRWKLEFNVRTGP